MFWWAWGLFADDDDGVDAKDVCPRLISFLMTLVAVTRYLHATF